MDTQTTIRLWSLSISLAVGNDIQLSSKCPILISRDAASLCAAGNTQMLLEAQHCEDEDNLHSLLILTLLVRAMLPLNMVLLF